MLQNRNITHALPVPVYRPISLRNAWSFRVYMIPLRDFVPEWNSRPGTRTGVNSHRGDSRRHDILWWYHVNKFRAMRGNQSELTPGQKLPRYHVNTPLASAKWWCLKGKGNNKLFISCWDYDLMSAKWWCLKGKVNNKLFVSSWDYDLVSAEWWCLKREG